MTTKRIALFLLTIIAIAALIAVHDAQRSRAQEEALTLHVVERATTDVVTDLGEEGDSVGDILTFANEIYDENNEVAIGQDNGYCVRTVVGAAWECFWTLMLESGQITVQGPFYDTGDSTLAITGGTGAFIYASGSMTLVFRDEAGTEFDFIYEIYGALSE
jgi:allene oxide cyclase